MIAFIVALYDEAKCLLDQLNNKKEIKLIDKPCFCGKIKDKDVIIAISGIGKVSSALTTQIIIDKFNPSLIFNFGTCGGIDTSVCVKDYYLIDKACQLDFDVTEIDQVPIGYIQEYDRVFFDTFIPKNNSLKVLSLASADKFTNDEKYIDIIKKSGAKLRDMEGGAIAQVCISNNVPLIILKGVTDIFGSESNSYYQNKLAICSGFYKKIIEIISLL